MSNTLNKKRISVKGQPYKSMQKYKQII